MVVRVDLASRARDTVTKFAVPSNQLLRNRDENGFMLATLMVNPLPWVDEWALMSSGRVAVVHGHDFQVDIYDDDDRMVASRKIPFDWHRISDEERSAIVDSTHAAQFAQNAASARTDSARRRRVLPEATITAASGSASAPSASILSRLDVVAPSELPDYRPPFQRSAARGDEDGNLWIRTSVVIDGGSVYDIIAGTGELRQRLLVPRGHVIAGFAADGVVYLAVLEGGIARLKVARAPGVGLR